MYITIVCSGLLIKVRFRNWCAWIILSLSIHLSAHHKSAFTLRYKAMVKLIPWMADRPMSSKKLRWRKKNGQKFEKFWNVISLLLLLVGSQKGMCYSSRVILGMFVTNSSFFHPTDRPTTEKPLVKNPPFKESTDCRLISSFEYSHENQKIPF